MPTGKVSARALPGYTTLKVRQDGQGTIGELAARDLKSDLLAREEAAAAARATKSKKRKHDEIDVAGAADQAHVAGLAQLSLGAEPDDDSAHRSWQGQRHALAPPFFSSRLTRLLALFFSLLLRFFGLSELGPADEKRQKLSSKVAAFAELDADDLSASGSASNAEGKQNAAGSSGSGSDSDSDMEALMEELARIKRERAAEAARAAREREEEEERRLDAAATAAIAAGGSSALASGSLAFSFRKSWLEDTVFKNQAATQPKEAVGLFVNDTTRNPFHRKFMRKYIH